MQTKERINRIKNWISDYCKNMPTEAKTLVIGISGGIDSQLQVHFLLFNGKENDCFIYAYQPNKRPA